MYKRLLWYILSSVSVIGSIISIMFYMIYEVCVFSWPISYVMILRICVLYLITITKSDVCIIIWYPLYILLCSHNPIMTDAYMGNYASKVKVTLNYSMLKVTNVTETCRIGNPSSIIIIRIYGLPWLMTPQSSVLRVQAWVSTGLHLLPASPGHSDWRPPDPIISSPELSESPQATLLLTQKYTTR